ncbi:MAG: acyl--CoA ligase [Proteobacteria bacterium]|nr:acyl--CoA ligase [Pseudomonadota bacterium]
MEKLHEAALATPDKPALVHDGLPIAYADFWRRIDACRRDLEPRVPQGGLALVSIGNLLDGWIVELALRALGLDTAAIPEPQHVALFADAQVTCVVTLDTDPRPQIATPPGAVRLTLGPPSTQRLDRAQPLPGLPAEPPAGRFGGHYMLTSGTTGVPKPILTHAGDSAEGIAALRGLAASFADPYAAQGPDTVQCLFDLGLWTAMGYLRPIFSWIDGATIVFDQRGGHHLALEWPGITHIHATPHYLAQVMAAPEGAFERRPDACVIMSAGALTAALARETRRRLTPTIVLHVASTEVGLWARSVVETDEDLLWHTIAPDRIVQVVDEADEPLPPGRLGRVRVGLARQGAASHLGDAADTARVYDRGWFYPGDLGVLDDEGRISLRGRATDVISIEGVKYPTEPWERRLQDRLACDGVCVLGGRFGGDVEQLHIFIETRAQIPFDRVVEAIRSTLAGFPEAQVHRIESLPRTPLGKIRRVELAQRLQNGEFRVPAAG